MDQTTDVFSEYDEAPLLFQPSMHYDIGPSLILAPHPDDESLGCGGMIALLRQKNVPVFACFITDGAASHTQSKSYPREKLASVRQQEAINACKELGIEEKHITFYKQPDGALGTLSDEKRLEISQHLVELLQNNAIKTVFAPYRKDAHPDHQATWKLIDEAFNKMEIKPALVEYPIWLWKNGNKEDYPRAEDFNFFRLDVTEVLDVKEHAINAHQSQVGDLITDDPQGFRLTPDLLAPFLKPAEYYFFSKRTHTETLSQSYFDELYRRQEDPWDFENSRYEHEKYTQSLNVLRSNYSNVLEVGCSIGIFTERLAPLCENLLAVDISEQPLKQAKERCRSYEQVRFKKMDVSINFPRDTYDLITLCEVGYYFSREELMEFFKNSAECLKPGGHVLLVHWTSYVAEYPLSGREVHQIFDDFNKRMGQFQQKTRTVHQAYELVLWEKS